MMLDMKSTFDDLVTPLHRRRSRPASASSTTPSTSTSPTPSRAAASTPPWRRSSSSPRIADFDFIVVDTPPSQHALDFLDAPRRLVEFLDSRLVQVLLHPSHVGGTDSASVSSSGRPRTPFTCSSESPESASSKISPSSCMAIEGMSEGFKDRAMQRARSDCSAPSSAFVLVAGPEPRGDPQRQPLPSHIWTPPGSPWSAWWSTACTSGPGTAPPPQELDPAGAESSEDLALLAGALAAAAGDADPAAHEARSPSRGRAAASDYASQVRMDITSSEPLRADAVAKRPFLPASCPSCPSMSTILRDSSRLGGIFSGTTGRRPTLEGGEDLRPAPTAR